MVVLDFSGMFLRLLLRFLLEEVYTRISRWRDMFKHPVFFVLGGTMEGGFMGTSHAKIRDRGWLREDLALMSMGREEMDWFPSKARVRFLYTL